MYKSRLSYEFVVNFMQSSAKVVISDFMAQCALRENMGEKLFNSAELFYENNAMLQIIYPLRKLFPEKAHKFRDLCLHSWWKTSKYLGDRAGKAAYFLFKKTFRNYELFGKKLKDNEPLDYNLVNNITLCKGFDKNPELFQLILLDMILLSRTKKITTAGAFRWNKATENHLKIRYQVIVLNLYKLPTLNPESSPCSTLDQLIELKQKEEDILVKFIYEQDK